MLHNRLNIFYAICIEWLRQSVQHNDTVFRFPFGADIVLMFRIIFLQRNLDIINYKPRHIWLDCICLNYNLSFITYQRQYTFVRQTVIFDLWIETIIKCKNYFISAKLWNSLCLVLPTKFTHFCKNITRQATNWIYLLYFNYLYV